MSKLPSIVGSKWYTPIGKNIIGIVIVSDLEGGRRSMIGTLPLEDVVNSNYDSYIIYLKGAEFPLQQAMDIIYG